jgi:peptidoglycan hydrolase CwlO-like protein
MQERILEKIESLNSLVNQFEALINKKETLEKEIDEVKSKMVWYEMGAKEVVLNTLDEETGKKKFTNDSQREIATNKILDTNKEYSDLKTKLDSFLHELTSIKNKIEITNKRVSVSMKQSDLIIALVNYKGGINE